jgi:hypothetical protein
MCAAPDERRRRILVAVKTKVLGRGGVAAVAAATGVSRSTIMAGLEDIEAMGVVDRAAPAQPAALMRMRRAGAGRNSLIPLSGDNYICRWRQLDLPVERVRSDVLDRPSPRVQRACVTPPSTTSVDPTT